LKVPFYSLFRISLPPMSSVRKWHFLLFYRFPQIARYEITPNYVSKNWVYSKSDGDILQLLIHCCVHWLPVCTNYLRHKATRIEPSRIPKVGWITEHILYWNKPLPMYTKCTKVLVVGRPTSHLMECIHFTTPYN